MATMFSYNLKPDPTVAANMQAWASWIESVLTTIGGWTVTADTGQTPPASLPGVPSSSPTNTKAGYRIYQMNDAFTAAFPIYMRVDFGNGAFNSSSLAWDVGITFSFGRATNGAGQLSGLLWNGIGGNPGYPTVSGNDSSGTKNYESRNYASADNSRFVLGMFINDFNNADGICFSLERSRDLTGAYTGDGIQITWTDPYLGGGYGALPCLSASKYIICADGGQPPFERGLSYAYPGRSPVFSPDGRIPVGLHCHSRGVAQQPGTNTVVLGINELLGEQQFPMHLYGVDHTYQHLKYIAAARAMAGPPGSTSALADAGIRTCIRYD